jgi:hypothetical protein
MSRTIACLVPLSAVLVLLCLVAPASAKDLHVTKKAYEKIGTGMSLMQVRQILNGKGVERRELEFRNMDVSVYEWKEGKKWIRVQFVNGRVVGKSQEGLGKK